MSYDLFFNKFGLNIFPHFFMSFHRYIRYCAICKWYIYCLIVCVPGGLWCPENGVHVAASERGVGQWIVQREALSRHSINHSINQSINTRR